MSTLNNTHDTYLSDKYPSDCPFVPAPKKDQDDDSFDLGNASFYSHKSKEPSSFERSQPSHSNYSSQVERNLSWLNEKRDDPKYRSKLSMQKNMKRALFD